MMRVSAGAGFLSSPALSPSLPEAYSPRGFATEPLPLKGEPGGVGFTSVFGCHVGDFGLNLKSENEKKVSNMHNPST